MSLFYLIIVPGIPALVLLVWMKRFVSRREQRSRRPFDEMLRPAGWSLQNRMDYLMGEFTLNFMIAMMIGSVAWALVNSTVAIPPSIRSQSLAPEQV
jgi:hypothetical protein